MKGNYRTFIQRYLRDFVNGVSSRASRFNEHTVDHLTEKFESFNNYSDTLAKSVMLSLFRIDSNAEEFLDTLIPKFEIRNPEELKLDLSEDNIEQQA